MSAILLIWFDFDSVMYSFAHSIDVRIERKCTINGDAKTLDNFRYSNRVGAECNSANYTFSSLSRTGADDDSLLFVGVQQQPFNANQC